MTRQTLQLALDALKETVNVLDDYIPSMEKRGAQLNYGRSVVRQAHAAITAIEQELAKPAQEPVAYIDTKALNEIIDSHGHYDYGTLPWTRDPVWYATAVYTAPVDQSERIKALEADNERLRDQVERLSLDLGLRDGK